jgi:hypothetical protein
MAKREWSFPSLVRSGWLASALIMFAQPGCDPEPPISGGSGGTTSVAGSGGVGTGGTGTNGGAAIGGATSGGTGTAGGVANRAPSMQTHGTLHPARYVTLATEATRFIGGIDRLVLDFTWTYDDPQAADEEESVEVTIGLTIPPFVPSASYATYTYPNLPFEGRGATWTLYGIALQTAALSIVTGEITIRLIGGVYDGTIDLTLTSGSTWPGEVAVSGSFSVPEPP